MGEDERGNPIFRVGIDKVFEMMGKDEVIPQYITWDGQLQAAFTELEHLIKMLLINAEIPEIVLGVGDAGTSGASGLAIKSLLLYTILLRCYGLPKPVSSS
ncbi:hypothetical protein [Heliorestis convoluta]|uniref:Uncharacterized protein n=1 Tax=Heliorestis convoluta TaxID=356322 RepID=A0A5Q2N621_9FIRM|nr:hypothetical protein [Heliorestis convoluta]QGG47700.1 hypothetical protein FTV88_1600 [Heliorestis convoluta]